MQNLKPTARREGLVIQELNDEVLIYDLNTNKAHCLNKTAGTVWKYCDGSNSVSDIAALLKKEFKAEVNEDLVWLALDQLKKENLMAKSVELKNKFDGMSRREVIRKVGIGAMIALPIVSSLVAPPAASAASPSACTASTCSCTGPRDIVTGNCTSTTCNSAVPNCICRRTNNGGNQGTCATS
jgi:hypothetical protein